MTYTQEFKSKLIEKEYITFIGSAYEAKFPKAEKVVSMLSLQLATY